MGRFTDPITSRFPRTINYGIKDESQRTLPTQDSSLPQLVPLIYMFAEKGKTNYVGSSANAIVQFGASTFDPLSKFFNHPTELRNLLVSEAAATCAYRRLVPEDAGVKANLVIWMDVIHTLVPNYKRNSDGSYRKEAGNKVLDDTEPYIPGHLIKWYSSALAEEQIYGKVKSQDGTICGWNFGDKETTVHALKETLDLEGSPTGHTDLANKTVYIYEKASDIGRPEANITQRKVFVVGPDGSASLQNTQTFDPEDGDATKRSTLYPVFEVKASHQGAYYNTLGISIAPSPTKVDSKYISELKAIPYVMTRYVKKPGDVGGTIYQTISGSNTAEFTLVKNGINPKTQQDFSLESVVLQAWDVENFEEVDKVYFYRDNYELILAQLIDEEKKHVSLIDKTWADGVEGNTISWYDFTDTDETTILSQTGVLNPFTCQSLQGVDYMTIKYDDTRPSRSIEGFVEENLGINAPIYLRGGNDGTLDYATFEQLVKKDLEHYLDENHIYQSIFASPENALFDTGFTLDTKKLIKNMIAVKKGTLVFLTTFEVTDEEDKTVEEIDAITTTIISDLKLVPESEYFATPTTRACIVAGTGDEGRGMPRKPLLIDLAVKIAKLMGGVERVWKLSARYDINPNHDITMFKNIKPAFIPPAVKDSLWGKGVTYPDVGERYHFFPAVKSVYGDDTSVLNAMMNVLPIAHIVRASEETWKEVVGTAGESNAIFKKKVESIANGKMTGSFGGIVNANATCIIDSFDEQTGYTYHLEWSVSGQNMRLIQIMSVIYTKPLDTK